MNGVTVIAGYNDETGDDVFRTEASLFSYRYWLKTRASILLYFWFALIFDCYCYRNMLLVKGARKHRRAATKALETLNVHCESGKFTIFNSNCRLQSVSILRVSISRVFNID